MTAPADGQSHGACDRYDWPRNWPRNNDFAFWRKPFGVYVWSDTLHFRFSWGPYFKGGWRPSFRRV